MSNITEDNNNIFFGKPVEHIDIDNGGQCSSRHRAHHVFVVVLDLGHDGHRLKRVPVGLLPIPATGLVLCDRTSPAARANAIAWPS